MVHPKFPSYHGIWVLLNFPKFPLVSGKYWKIHRCYGQVGWLQSFSPKVVTWIKTDLKITPEMGYTMVHPNQMPFQYSLMMFNDDMLIIHWVLDDFRGQLDPFGTGPPKSPSQVTKSRRQRGQVRFTFSLRRLAKIARLGRKTQEKLGDQTYVFRSDPKQNKMYQCVWDGVFFYRYLQ